MEDKMKISKRILSALFIISLMTFAVTGYASQGIAKDNTRKTSTVKKTLKADMPADPSINPDNAQFWRKTIQKYRKDDNVHQVLLVRYTGGCGAIAQFYEKSKYNNAWELTLESSVYVGKHGIGKTGEGDSKSPSADIGIRRAFGILPNPGTKLDYLDVVESTYACDENCEYYNQIIDTTKTGHKCTGEDMFTYSPEYNYGIESSFNNENKYPEGSAIFIHCKGAKAFTGGCIAFDQKDMKYILQHADNGMRIVIGEN